MGTSVAIILPVGDNGSWGDDSGRSPWVNRGSPTRRPRKEVGLRKNVGEGCPFVENSPLVESTTMQVRFRISFFFALAVCGCSLVADERIRFERIQLSDQFYSEGGTYGDYDGDGHGDVAVGPNVYWGPDFEESSAIYAGEPVAPIGYSNNFLMFSDDVDADGHLDILVLGFPGKESWWYRNPGQNVRSADWSEYVLLESVDNESPLIADIDGDGIEDLVCSTAGQYGYASHAGQDPTDLWKFTPITPKNSKYQRFTHGLGIGDVDNDGDQDLLEAEGWWCNPGKSDNNEFWQFNAYPFSKGGSQMYAVDLDVDGKNEIVSGLVAHGYGLAYYRAANEQATQFTSADIMTADAATSPTGLAISQLHAVDVADINQDGLIDIVTGKRWWAHANHDDGHSEPATLLWLETQHIDGQLRFLPHVVDNSSGVGTQITAGDVNGDGLIDIVSGNKRGAYVFLQRPAELAADQAMVSGLARQDPFNQRPADGQRAIQDDAGGFLPTIAGRPANFGFETGDSTDWELRGPIAKGAISKLKKSGSGAFGKVSGDYVFDSDLPGKRMIGEAVSRPFALQHPEATLWIRGTKNSETRVEVVSVESGKVLASVTPDGSDKWQERSLDLSAWHGQWVRLRLVDHAENGSLQFDAFRMRAH